MGSADGYGPRRPQFDEYGNPKDELSRGKQKSLKDRPHDPGAKPRGTAAVRSTRVRYVRQKGRPEREIAETLSADRHRTDLGRPWTRAIGHQGLTIEKYIGNNGFAKLSFKPNPPGTLSHAIRSASMCAWCRPKAVRSGQREPLELQTRAAL